MNAKKKKLLSEYEEKVTAQAALLAKGEDLTSDDIQSAKALNTEIETLSAQMLEQDDLEEMQQKNTQHQSALNRPATGVPHRGSSGSAKVLGYTDAGETIIDEKEGRVEGKGYGLIAQSKYKHLVTEEYKSAFTEMILKGGIDRCGSTSVKALQEGLDDEGGYFAPPDWVLDIIRREPTPSNVNSNVRTWQTARDAKIFPKISYTGASDDPNANLYSTGVRVNYVGESAQNATDIDSTQPVTGQLRVDVHTAMMALSITNDMMEDAAIDMTAFLEDVFGETISLEYDNRIINGTGTGQARGLLVNPSSSATGDEPQYIASGDANHLMPDGLMDLVFSIAPQYLKNAKFLFNWLSAAKEISKMKDGDGTYLWSQGSQDNRLNNSLMDRRLLGFSPVYSEFMPAIAANAFPVAFGDLMAYYLVQRIGFSIQVLRETKAKINQIELVGRLRFGGRIAKPWALKLQKIAA